MNRSLLEKAITQTAPLVKQAMFHLMGDPLAYPDLAYALDLAHTVSLPITLTTAGHLLSSQRQELFHHPAIRQINFSLNSYNENPQKTSLETYLETLSRIVDHLHTHRPDLYINWRLWNIGNDESQSFNHDVFSFINTRFGHRIQTPCDVTMKKSKKLFGRFYLHFDSLFTWPSLDDQAPPRMRGFCHALSGQFGILCDGRVVPCCLDKEGVMSLGSLDEAPLEQILASPKARAIKEGFARHQRIESLCQHCTYIDRFSK